MRPRAVCHTPPERHARADHNVDSETNARAVNLSTSAAPKRAVPETTPAAQKRADVSASPEGAKRAVPETTPETTPLLPFAKWVGGKRKLAAAILERRPPSFTTYHEPFLGGGAVFFALQPRLAYLSDCNEDLIECYRTVRDEPDEVLEHMRRLGHPLRAGETWKSRYLKVRDQWNEIVWHPAMKAAVMIYMLQTCFNGLWRENKSGKNNVPYGDAKGFNPDETNFRACSKALADVNITVEDFEAAIESAAGGSWVYCDSPYAGTYDGYSAAGFTHKDQARLAAALQRATARGAHWTASNSNHELIRHLYRGHRIEEIVASRSNAADGKKRGSVTELLIRNF